MAHTKQSTATMTGADGWQLRPQVNLSLIVTVLTVSLLLAWSAQRNQLTRLPGQLVGGVGEAAGLLPQSEIGPAIRKMLTGLFPPDVSEKTDVSRVEGLDLKHPPLFCRIVYEPVKSYDALQGVWRTLDTRPFLYDPIGYLKRVLLLMFQTIEIAVWGTLLALFTAVPLAFFAARGYTPNKATYLLARGLASGTRALPEMISALVLVMIFGFGAIPGVMALAISTTGFLGKFLAEDIENADPGPQEALRCLGANKLKVLRYAVFPQVMPQYVAYMQYMFERNVRAATAIGIVGAGGIGMELKGRWDMFDFSHFSTVMIVMLVTVLALERLSQLIRSRLIA